MGKRGDKGREYNQKTWATTITRDKGKCQVCGSKASDVHEIVSRAHFGSRTQHLCYALKNRCCVCDSCHRKVQGQEKWMVWLLVKMRNKYGYKYPEPTFQRYLRLEGFYTHANNAGG
jgi:hypothetical protein